MKKFNRYILSLIFLSGVLLNGNSFGQLVIFPASNIPDTTAWVDQVYQFKDSAITDYAKYPITYSLVKARPGMVIGGSTGIITWTPPDINSGGKVIVKATNKDGDTARHEFYIYVSDGIPCPDGLEAYWKLDEMSGTTYSDWIGTNDAAASTNAPKDTVGIVERSKYFDPANNEGLSVAADDIFNWATDESFSIEFWFKNNVASYDSISIIMGRNEGSDDENVHWWFGFLADDTLNFIVRKQSGEVARCRCLIGNTNWHHVVGVRDAVNNMIRLYVDKIYADNDSYDGSGPGLVSLTEPLTIGYLQPDPGSGKRFPYDGMIDDVKLYGKALSSTEITASYTKGNNHKPACQVGNFAPIFITDPELAVSEDTPYNYTFNARDIDSADVLSYTVENTPAWLTYNSVTRTFSGTPGNENVGGYLILIKVSDTKVDVFQNFTLMVKNLNDPPVITSTPDTLINEEEAFSYQVTATDIDAGDHLTYSAPVKPGWLSIDGSTGLLSGTAPLNDTAEYSVTVRVTDDSSAYKEQSFVLDIRNINDPPVLSGQPPLSIDEDHSHEVTLDDLYYDDPDDGPGELMLTLKNGINYTRAGSTVTPEANYHGTIKVPFELTDGEYTVADTLTITVNSVNDLPVITSAPIIAVNEDMDYLYNITVADNDPEDVIILSGVTIPDWLTLNTTARTLSGKPDNTQVGYSPDSSFIVKLKVTDGKQDSTQEFVLTVYNVDDAPVVHGQIDTLLAYTNAVLVIQLSDVDVTDVDNMPEDLSFIFHSGDGYTVTGQTITINSDAPALIHINLRVTDGAMASEIFELAVKVEKGSGTDRNLIRSDLINNVYPIPASDFIRFEFQSLNRQLIFELYNLQGNMVLRKELEISTNALEINVSDLSSGIYFYKFFDEESYETGKVFIEK